MEELVVIYRGHDEAECNIVKSALEDNGIRAIIKTQNTSWLDGLMVAADGFWGEILIRPEDADKAYELISEYEKSESILPDDAEETQDS